MMVLPSLGALNIGAITQKWSFLVICTTFRFDFYISWKNQFKHSTCNSSFYALSRWHKPDIAQGGTFSNPARFFLSALPCLSIRASSTKLIRLDFIPYFYRNVESGQTIRLSGGQEVHTGYLEVKSGGQWNLVCNNDSSWDMQAATVACR